MSADEMVSPTRRVAAALGGAAGLLAVWQLIGAGEVFGTSIAPPSDVIEVFGESQQRSRVVDAALSTGSSALWGFAWAVLLAALVGAVAVLVPHLRRGADQLATMQSAAPFVALAPIFLANFDRTTVPIAMAASTAFFTFYVAFTSGLEAASPALYDVLTVFGGSRRARFVRVQLPAALPVVAAGFKVGMPLAIVGAVIGEWFGASNGVGPLLLTALRNYQMPLMWAVASATVALALVLFGVMAAFERAMTERFGG
ncbi:MAG: ABC transporter permease subunit [Actinomycetota bacterium]|nr:ABC transporter permease subunit [Actinomycetota bacterium]